MVDIAQAARFPTSRGPTSARRCHKVTSNGSSPQQFWGSRPRGQTTGMAICRPWRPRRWRSIVAFLTRSSSDG